LPDSIFWNGKRVLVTGGAGFLGKQIVPKLEHVGANVFVPSSIEFDLRRENKVNKLFKAFKPQIVLHLAANGGGIGYMRQHSASVFDDNILINTFVLRASKRFKAEKFVGIGSVCEYPKFTPCPFREENLWDGYPEETNAPYGLSKKMMLVQTQSYRQQYGFNGIHLLLVNLYGPYDDFNLEQSHVIPALIKKMIAAKIADNDTVEVWGSGAASREFLFSEDAAEAIFLASERYNKSDPVNIGSGKEIAIRDLVAIIARLTEFDGSIVWDKTKPDGQPKRCLDVSKAKNEFGFAAKTSFEEGLRKTIDWYMQTISK
jgi:GDP-L-fucose synthase